MEVSEIGGQLRDCHIVDIVIEALDALLPIVADRQTSRLGERHGKVRVQSANRSNRGQRRLVQEIFTKAQPEKISDGHFDRRLGFSIPISAQHQFLQMERLIRVNREPDMSNDPWLTNFQERGGLAGLENDEVSVGSGAIVAGSAFVFVLAKSREISQV